MMRGRRGDEDEEYGALYDLSALVLNLILPSRRPTPHISPLGFASLLLGISVALMLCGSVTFFIGFVLMPWVITFLILFYVAGILSTLSLFGRSIICYATSPPKDIPAWKLM